MAEHHSLLILLIDADKSRVNTLTAKMKPFGYKVHHCVTIASS